MSRLPGADRITENEAEETYLSSLETEADFFASAFLIDDLTDDSRPR